MLGQDEHETDTKNRTSTNSASEITNPLNGKKTISGFGIAHSDVQARIYAQITVLGIDQ